MEKNNYEEFAKVIIKNVGGNENIQLCFHCATRLRFNLKDLSLVNVEEMNKIKGIVGTQVVGDQFQIIIGQSVGEVYKEICRNGGIHSDGSKNVNSDESKSKNKFSIKSSLSNLLNAITGCITPLIPAFVGAGMLKILLLVLTMSGVLLETSSTYQILSFSSDMVFYFFPIMIGSISAKRFGGNQSLGMMLGAILVAPGLIENVANGVDMSIFGIPVYATTYTQTIFPAIISVFVMSKVEKMFTKYSPKLLQSILVPLGTLLVMIPLMLCLLAPLGSFIGVYLAAGIMWIYNTIGFMGVAILSCFLPFLILTGMHYGFMPYWLGSLATLGYEPIYILSNVIYNVNQGIACLAVSLKTKQIDLKGIASSAGIASIVAGVSEPALFGVTLRLKTPLWCSMIGCFVGGAIAGAFKVLVYAIPGTWGILSLPIFIDNGSNLICLIIALVVSSLITFGLTMFIYKDVEKGEVYE